MILILLIPLQVVALVMLPVDTTKAVMCHVLIVFGMLFRGLGSRCGYCMFSRSVDTCYRLPPDITNEIVSVNYLGLINVLC